MITGASCREENGEFDCCRYGLQLPAAAIVFACVQNLRAWIWAVQSSIAFLVRTSQCKQAAADTIDASHNDLIGDDAFQRCRDPFEQGHIQNQRKFQ